MPIAICFIKKRLPAQMNLSKIVDKWAEYINVKPKDITINLISEFIQIGNCYEIMVNLYLPSLWSDEDINNIQMQLMKVLIDHFKVEASEIFIISTTIQSGHVIENGKTMKW